MRATRDICVSGIAYLPGELTRNAVVMAVAVGTQRVKSRSAGRHDREAIERGENEGMRVGPPSARQANPC
jgi:hypothetical protein